jgi:recF protein
MDHKVLFHISSIELKNFRCFSSFKLAIEKPILLLEASNGKGKTSILEALYYACYLRSFRTHTPKEMVQFGHKDFFIHLQVQNNLHTQGLTHEIQIGFTHNKRLVKVDKQTIASYKDLMSHYRVVSLTEDDIALVKESPQIRRTFMDHALLLMDADYAQELRTYRQVVDQRNALLEQRRGRNEMYEILTEQLWTKSCQIQKKRIELLKSIQHEINIIIAHYFENAFTISYQYGYKYAPHETIIQFHEANPRLYEQEGRFARSLFGAHLDDMVIFFHDHHSKHFASRGQQKLIVLLTKVAVMRRMALNNEPAVFLLDDFITDFDPDRAQILLKVLHQLNSQLIFTSPLEGGVLHDSLKELGAQIVKLTY